MFHKRQGVPPSCSDLRTRGAKQFSAELGANKTIDTPAQVRNLGDFFKEGAKNEISEMHSR